MTRTSASEHDAEPLLSTGRRLLAFGDWASARDAFSAALASEETGDAFAGLGDALCWLGETDEAVRCQQRAYTAFNRQPDPFRAALAAVALYFLYRVSLGNTAAARGWLHRLRAPGRS